MPSLAVAPVDEQAEQLARRRTPKISRRLRHGMSVTPHASRWRAQELEQLRERRVVGDDADRHAEVGDARAATASLFPMWPTDAGSAPRAGRRRRADPRMLVGVEVRASRRAADLVGGQRRQAHQLDEVAPVVAVGAQRQPADARVVRRQPQDVPEVAVRPAPLGRPERGTRPATAEADRPRRARPAGTAWQQPGRRRGRRTTARPLDDPRAGAPASMRRLECGASSRRRSPRPSVTSRRRPTLALLPASLR